MKKLIITLLLILTLLPHALAVDIPAFYFTGTMYVVGCHTSVTLREEPNTSSLDLAQIPRNTQVECEPYNEQFARVTYKEQTGYVLTEYLDVDPEGDHGMFMWVANCDSWVSLRETASKSAERVAKIPKGTRVFVDGESDDFYSVYISSMDLEGFILKGYLSEN